MLLLARKPEGLTKIAIGESERGGGGRGAKVGIKKGRVIGDH